mgnify:CR=1 FL=1
MSNDEFSGQISDGTPAKVAEPSGNESSPAKATGVMKFFWITIAILCGIYVFIPEPTDAIPILGWLDEGTAILVMSYALDKVGVKVPIINRYLNRKKDKSKS